MERKEEEEDSQGLTGVPRRMRCSRVNGGGGAPERRGARAGLASWACEGDMLFKQHVEEASGYANAPSGSGPGW